MNKLLITGIGISIVLLFSCKRSTQPGPSPTVSNSQYDSVQLTLYRFTNIYKDSMGIIDSTEKEAESTADFGEKYRDLRIKSVFLNADTLFRTTTQNYYPRYYRPWWPLDEAAYHSFDACVWKIVSNNDVTDMTYTVHAVTDFDETVPYNISRSNSLTLSFDPVKYRDVDSMLITIDGPNGPPYGVDTMISTHTGIVTFSPSQMSMIQYGTYNKGHLTVAMGRSYLYQPASGRTYNLSVASQVKYDINIVP